MSPENQAHPARRRRVDAERNRDAVLSAAGRLFDEHGPDVPLDEIAKTAGVANATLYRHFRTRADLLVAVYADEVAALDRQSQELAGHEDPDVALTQWLRAFADHVATKRELAQAVPDDPDRDRGAQFASWHATMYGAADRLLDRARTAGAVRAGLTTRDLLTAVSGIALTGCSGRQLQTLLDLIRDGYHS
ncbi:helix-turn-helix domain-containing protein [Kribbella sp.]|uniref:TetR/AcrR family transcriptional regulator n=1 Tax=Kribbella sp. TaxID=1871183 RepID=UPI002D52EB68|nr:helix-turn-helix domain-containing protein [Kribbella sp.]HZX03764.1 helix-turn-helix domain-containing protein [Kribbella sp.]